jgi:hypothetical protein
MIAKVQESTSVDPSPRLKANGYSSKYSPDAQILYFLVVSSGGRKRHVPHFAAYPPTLFQQIIA